LGNDEDVAGKSAFKHDRHIRGIKEFDGVCEALATEAVALHRDLNAEALEVDYGSENSDGGKKVHDVGQTIPKESLLEGTALVVLGEEEMEECNNGAFELGSTTSVNGGRAEGLPNNRLAGVGCDEERNARPETIALLEKLIEENDDEGSGNELKNQEKTDACANF